MGVHSDDWYLCQEVGAVKQQKHLHGYVKLPVKRSQHKKLIKELKRVVGCVPGVKYKFQASPCNSTADARDHAMRHFAGPFGPGQNPQNERFQLLY